MGLYPKRERHLANRNKFNRSVFEPLSLMSMEISDQDELENSLFNELEHETDLVGQIAGLKKQVEMVQRKLKFSTSEVNALRIELEQRELYQNHLEADNKEKTIKVEKLTNLCTQYKLEFEEERKNHLNILQKAIKNFEAKISLLKKEVADKRELITPFQFPSIANSGLIDDAFKTMATTSVVDTQASGFSKSMPSTFQTIGGVSNACFNCGSAQSDFRKKEREFHAKADAEREIYLKRITKLETALLRYEKEDRYRNPNKIFDRPPSQSPVTGSASPVQESKNAFIKPNESPSSTFRLHIPGAATSIQIPSKSSDHEDVVLHVVYPPETVLVNPESRSYRIEGKNGPLAKIQPQNY